MKVPESSDETPLAWTAILARTPVRSRDGEEVGHVVEVVGAQAEDIFHGLAVGHGTDDHGVLIPAESVGAITDRRIDTNLTAEEIRALPVYVPEDAFKLGFVGFFSKHLGWVEDRRD
ncbi:MAG: hypothetical protein NVSMB52_03350 [Chloroflexota bacterium]